METGILLLRFVVSRVYLYDLPALETPSCHAAALEIISARVPAGKGERAVGISPFYESRPRFEVGMAVEVPAARPRMACCVSRPSIKRRGL